jgi:HEAT repeat protein
MRELLTDANPVVRRNAAWVLGRLKSDFGLPVLLRDLRDPDASVRYHAARILGEVGATAAAAALTEALDDAADSVRTQAGEALMLLDSARFAETILDRLDRPGRELGGQIGYQAALLVARSNPALLVAVLERSLRFDLALAAAQSRLRSAVPAALTVLERRGTRNVDYQGYALAHALHAMLSGQPPEAGKTPSVADLRALWEKTQVPAQP